MQAHSGSLYLRILRSVNDYPVSTLPYPLRF
jgi:hypothetical protein